MRISELKQPYRRMAEYLSDKNINPFYTDNKYLSLAFSWYSTDEMFWEKINFGEYPPITEEIKKHFPPDFDFSGEEVEEVVNKFKNVEIPFNFNIFNSMLKKEVKDTFYLDAKEYYTQLAKGGNFDKLPDTCEFSEAVELEVWDFESVKDNRMIVGKFKNLFMAVTKIDNEDYRIFKYAQLPTPKIDFSEFKSGDVVEVELSNEEKRIGWFDYTDRNQLVIKTLKRKGNQVCNGGSCSGSKMFNLEKIKSITKIK